MTSDITLYAKWTATSTENAYFLAKGGLDNTTLTKLAAGTATDSEKTTNLFVSQAQIDADIATLSGADSTTAKILTITKWEGYMNSDNGTADANTMHLYTAWSGSTGDDTKGINK